MLQFVLLEANKPFAVALLVMLIIALVEGVASLIGGGFSSLLESLLPEGVDAPGLGDADPGGASAVSHVLNWLCVGKVPVLVLIILFLTVFGLLGLGVQTIVMSVFSVPLPAVAAFPLAILISIPVFRAIAVGLAKIVPQTETTAVSVHTFIGRIATVGQGGAAAGRPCQAKLRDEHGQVHYVLVEPDDGVSAFPEGSEVLLVQRSGSRFRVILNDNPALLIAAGQATSAARNKQSPTI